MERQNELYRRACEIIPGGTQTWSKRLHLHAPGATPAFIERGEGSYVWDIEGKKYLDLSMSLTLNGQTEMGILFYNRFLVMDSHTDEQIDFVLDSMDDLLWEAGNE